MTAETRCTAFEGTRRIATGELRHVAMKAKEVIDRGERAPVLIFDDATSERIEVDFRGTARSVMKRLPAAAPPQSQHPRKRKRAVRGVRG